MYDILMTSEIHTLKLFASSLKKDCIVYKIMYLNG